jgi:hypothetical protein
MRLLPARPGLEACGYPAAPTADSLDSGVTASDSLQIAYDSAGNIRTITDPPNTANGVIAGYQISNRDTAWISPADTLHFAYDSDGHRDSRTGPGGSRTYAWSADGRLMKVTAGTHIVNYSYYPNGLLMSRSFGSTPVVDRYYLWDRGTLRAEIDSTGMNRITEYVYGGTDAPIARILVRARSITWSRTSAGTSSGSSGPHQIRLNRTWCTGCSGGFRALGKRREIPPSCGGRGCIGKRIRRRCITCARGGMTPLTAGSPRRIRPVTGSINTRLLEGTRSTDSIRPEWISVATTQTPATRAPIRRRRRRRPLWQLSMCKDCELRDNAKPAQLVSDGVWISDGRFWRDS